MHKNKLLKIAGAGALYALILALLTRITTALGATLFITDGGLSGAFVLLALSSLFAILGAIGAISITSYILKNIGIVTPLATSLLAGSIVYLLTQVLVAYSGSTFVYIPIVVLSALIFIVTERILNSIIRIRKIVLLMAILFAGLIFYITPSLERSASNLSFAIKYSDENIEKNARKTLGFQPLIPVNSRNVNRTVATIRTGNQDELNKLSNNTYVRVQTTGDGFSAYLYETLPFESLAKYVAIPDTCELIYLSHVISNKSSYGRVSSDKPLIGEIEPSSCLLYAVTPKGKKIYGQSVPSNPERGTFYYFVREGDVIISIEYRPFGLNDGGKNELIELVDSLGPSDPDKIKFED